MSTSSSSSVPLNGLLRFTTQVTRNGAGTPTVPLSDVPLWAITRSYFDMGQHLHDASYTILARRLGTDLQTVRKWVRRGWSKTMLIMVDRSDIMDELAMNRSYTSIAQELMVDEHALRAWCRLDPELLRAAEEYKAEVQIDMAKRSVTLAGDISDVKAASTLLTHAQWSAERLYRTKFRPNAEQPVIPFMFNFDLGPDHARTIGLGTTIQGGPNTVRTLHGPAATDLSHGTGGFG